MWHFGTKVNLLPLLPFQFRVFLCLSDVRGCSWLFPAVPGLTGKGVVAGGTTYQGLLQQTQCFTSGVTKRETPQVLSQWNHVIYTKVSHSLHALQRILRQLRHENHLRALTSNHYYKPLSTNIHHHLTFYGYLFPGRSWLWSCFFHGSLKKQAPQNNQLK